MNRKLIFAVAAASALLLSSCRKADEVTPSESQFDELEFTATIDGPVTKTTVNTNKDSQDRGKIEWEKGDSILIKDAKGNEVYYVTEEGDGTFRKKAGQTGRLAYDSKYSATYGTKPSTPQKYADYYGGVNQAKNVYMETPESENRSLKFTAAYGLLKLTLTAADGADESITKIKVTGNTGEYTLDCGTAGVSTKYGSSDGVFYLSLPAGTYTKMVFCNAKGIECEVTGSSKIDNNKIQPVTIDDITFETEPVFSVSTSKKVKFTGGNLWWDGKAFHLETSQTAYPTSWSTDHVGHFFWTNLTDYQSATASYMPYASSYSYSYRSVTDKFWCGEDNKLTVDGQSGLYALTKGEWVYLISTRMNASDLRKYGVTVSDGSKSYKNCLIIAPDDYSGTALSSITDWSLSNINSLGLVCLPAAGSRDGSNLNYGGTYGYYWSATLDEYEKDIAYSLFFLVKSVDPSYIIDRESGSSVRLVSSVK